METMELPTMDMDSNERMIDYCQCMFLDIEYRLHFERGDDMPHAISLRPVLKDQFLTMLSKL